MNTTKKTIQLFFILALISGGLWNLNSCKDDNSEILEKIDQVDKSLSDKIDALSKSMADITKALQGLTTKVGGLATKEDVAAVKDVVDKLTTALTQVSTTVSGLKDAISDDVKEQLETQLTAIKTAMDALQTALEQKIATATEGTTKGDYQALLDQLKALKAELDAVKADLEGEIITEKQHYEDILKSLQAKDMYKIDDVHFAYFLRAKASIKDAFLFTDEDLKNKELLATLSLTKDQAAILIKKMDDKVVGLNELKVTDTASTKITSLKAIEIFTALTILDASGLKGLESLQITNANEQLQTLNVSGDIALDDNSDLLVDKCTALKTLNASGTNIKGLKISANLALEDLNLHNCANLQTLDASNNNVLAVIDVIGCSSMTTLNVSNTSLESLNINGDTLPKLAKVDAENCTKLKTLNANRPDLSHGSIVSLDVSNDYSLTTLTANNNDSLNSLKLTNDKALVTLEANFADFSAGLKLTDLGTNNKLTTLTVSNTSLSTLDISANHNLVTCIARTEKPKKGLITSITLPGGTSFHTTISKELLEILDVSNNKLTFINLSNLAKLKQLNVSYNLITGETPSKGKESSSTIAKNYGLDTHINKDLVYLNVSDNSGLSSLRLYNNGKLDFLNIESTKVATASI